MKKIYTIFAIFLIILSFCVYNHFSNINTTTPKNIAIAQTNTTNEIVNETNNSIAVELPQKQDTHVKLSVIGDIMCHNSQYIDAFNSEQNTYDFSYVFDDIKKYISNSDIAIGNLETTFAGSNRGYSNYPRFNTPEQLSFNLKDLGIDILSTANNHCMDTNYDGLVSTLNFLDQAEISHIGTNRSIEEQNTILIKEIDNIKIAFLSFTYGTNGITIPTDKNYAVNLINTDLILNQLNNAKNYNPDIICVNMHWGTEYQTTQNETQEELADFLFKNGVDIILGSHPHVLQPMEKRNITLENGTQKECFVIYSLGNFMSAQTQKNTRSSIILNINLLKDGYSEKTSIETIDYTPIYMYKGNIGKKYKILDIQKSIFKYESGIDTSIGQNNYSILKSEFERIRNIYQGFDAVCDLNNL